jgi:hypothetical protein
VIRPIFVLCQSLEEISINHEFSGYIDSILVFIEESFSRFMQKPYSFFDEAASLVEGQVELFSCILLTFRRQWHYVSNKDKDETFSAITEWFYVFILHLLLIGEDSGGMIALMASMDKKGGHGKELSSLRDDVLQWIPPSKKQDQQNEDLLPGNKYHSFILKLILGNGQNCKMIL